MAEHSCFINATFFPVVSWNSSISSWLSCSLCLYTVQFFPKISSDFWLLIHIYEWKIRLIIIGSLYRFLCTWIESPIRPLPWQGKLGIGLKRLAFGLPGTHISGKSRCCPIRRALLWGRLAFLRSLQGIGPHLPRDAESSVTFGSTLLLLGVQNCSWRLS